MSTTTVLIAVGNQRGLDRTSGGLIPLEDKSYLLSANDLDDAGARRDRVKCET
jgi:hypothetical protein